MDLQLNLTVQKKKDVLISGYIRSHKCDDEMRDFVNDGSKPIEMETESPLFRESTISENSFEEDKQEINVLEHADDSTKQQYHPVVEYIRFLIENKFEDQQQIKGINMKGMPPDLNGGTE